MKGIPPVFVLSRSYYGVVVVVVGLGLGLLNPRPLVPFMYRVMKRMNLSHS